MAASSDNRGNERSGGGDGEEEARTDGWMTTYSDMVTLLLTFFVLMFALSNIDDERVEMFLFAMSRDGLTAEQFMEIQDRHRFDPSDGSEWDDLLPYPEPGAADEEHGFEEGETEGERALRELYEAIGFYIDDVGLGDSLGLVFNGEFLMLTIANDILFEPGRANVTPLMEEIAGAVGGLLASNINHDDPFEVVVAGHTDNVPMGAHAHIFPTNWHLSQGRAMAFLELLIEESDLDPPLFYMKAAGEYRPIASNETPEGRQANRRVEVMIALARANPLWDGGITHDY